MNKIRLIIMGVLFLFCSVSFADSVDWNETENQLYSALKETQGNQSDAELEQAMGYKLEEYNRPDRATVHFKKAVELDPDIYKTLCSVPENTAFVEERTGVVTMKGKPITLLGKELKVGEKAPDFVVQATDLSDARLSGFFGKIKLIASVPSLDTPVCDLEIHRFNHEAALVSNDVVILFISMDLPFAQKRFCSAADIKSVRTFSDHRTADFGINYGVLIKDLRLLSRAIFIVDKNDVVRYVEYVKEEGTHPDYDSALKALKMQGT